jgi:hypothetical protein
MFCNTRVAFAVVALLSAAASAPNTAWASSVGHGRAASFGRGVAPFMPQNRPGNSPIGYSNIRCRSVQVGDPRRQPAELICS